MALRIAFAVLLLCAVAPRASGADRLELLSGAELVGTVEELTDEAVTFSTDRGMTAKFRLALVHAVERGGTRTVVNPRPDEPAVAPAATGGGDDPAPTADPGGGATAAPAPQAVGSPQDAGKPGLAHDPAFGNRQLWPHLTGHEAFARQRWPAARVLVWAHPGEGAGGRQGVHDVSAASSWLENGRPATRPPEDGVDIVLPESSTPYTVSVDTRGFTLRPRHVTVGRNACLLGVERLAGNLWVKAGARFTRSGVASGALRIVGPAHTFARNDNAPSARAVNGGVAGRLGQWLLVEKPDDASVEFIGSIGAADEMMFNEGVCIVGPGAIAHVGTASIQIVGPEATLQIQSGGRFSKRGNMGNASPDMIVMGRLMGGSPERPLVADAHLALSYKVAGGGQLEVDTRGLKGGGGGMTVAPVGLVVEPRGSLEVYSADPSSARLAIAWHGFGGQGEGIAVALLGRIRPDGLFFDHLRAGGLQVADPAAARSWSHVFFGGACQGGPDRLIAAFAGR